MICGIEIEPPNGLPLSRRERWECHILTRTEYDRKRKALLATAQIATTPTAFNEARAVAMLADMPTLMAAATPSERRAVVGALFDKVWIQEKGIIAVTPRADIGPVLAGLAQIQYGCLDGVPDGFRTRNLLSHSQALCR